MGFSFFSNKKQVERATAAASKMNYLAASSVEAAGANEARNIAAEEAKGNIFAALGQPGTYEPGSGVGTMGDGSTNMYDENAGADEGILKMGGGRATRDLASSKRAGIIDPEGYANKTIGTTPFKIRSKLTAEAYQLLNREGEEWDRLENSTLGNIYEGAALQLRAAQRQINNDLAKGSGARSSARAMAARINVAESAHQARVQETWRANLDLHNYIRSNAERVQQGNISYTESLPGLNGAYRSAMQSVAALKISANEKAAIIAGESYEIRASQQAVNFGGKLLEAVTMAAVSGVMDKGAVAMGGVLDDYSTANPDTFLGGAAGFAGDVLSNDGKGLDVDFTDANAAALNRDTSGGE